MSATKLTDNVYSVGVKDPDLRVFDIIMKTQYGTTYNSYLVVGSEKTALIDSVKRDFLDEFIANIDEITPVGKIDYLVVNHNEPDHSGAIGTWAPSALPAGQVLREPAPLFRKLDESVIEEEYARLEG